jgi:hypothetical protein
MTLASLMALITATESISGQLAPAPITGLPSVFNSVLPRAYKLPAIAVHRYAGAWDQDFLGPNTTREDSFQLDIYGSNGDTAQAVIDACRTFFTGFTGTLSDGTVVLGAYLEQDRDMPFLPNADTQSMAFRSLLCFRFVTQV